MSLDDRDITRDAQRALAEAAEPMPREARARVRRQIVAAARARSRIGLLGTAGRKIAAVAAAFSLLSGGAAFAAENSLPGDPLYGLKRGAEDVLLAVIPEGAVARGLRVEIAARRAAEVGEMARRGDEADEIDAAVSRVRSAIRQAAPTSSDLTDDELARIRRHSRNAPADVQGAVDDAINQSVTEPMQPSVPSESAPAPSAPGPSPSGEGSGTPESPTGPGGGSGGQGDGPTGDKGGNR